MKNNQKNRPHDSLDLWSLCPAKNVTLKTISKIRKEITFEASKDDKTAHLGPLFRTFNARNDTRLRNN